MRDIALTLFFLAVMAYALRRHYALPMVWAWLSMMNPHRLAYGFAYSFPFAQVTAVTTLLLFPFTKYRHPFPRCTPAVLLIVFYLWVCITSLASFNDSAEVLDMWLKVTKIQLMILITLMMIRGRRQIDLLIWVIALSIGFYGIKGGVFTIIKGGRSMVLGPSGSFIEGSNEIALAMMMIVPLFYYLAKSSSRKGIRIALYVSMALTMLSVLGTTSRGALLAICAMSVFLGLKSGRPVVTTVIAVIGLFVLTTMMSDQWSLKMAGIATHEDHSAQSRIYTWRMIWNMVQYHPWTGGGYRITENPLTWQVYAVTDYLKAYAPHSIYFQALAEHGFIGLFIYVSLGVTTYRLASSVARRAKSGGVEWAVMLMGMCQASLIGFAVGGAFVGLVNFDLPYYFAVFIILVDRALREAPVPTDAALPSGAGA